MAPNASLLGISTELRWLILSYLLPNVDTVPHRVEKEYSYGGAVNWQADTGMHSRDMGSPYRIGFETPMEPNSDNAYTSFATTISEHSYDTGSSYHEESERDSYIGDDLDTSNASEWLDASDLSEASSQTDDGLLFPIRNWPQPLRSDNLECSLAILRVNHQIYEEAMDFLYRQRYFSVEVDEDGVRFLGQWYKFPFRTFDIKDCGEAEESPNCDCLKCTSHWQ